MAIHRPPATDGIRPLTHAEFAVMAAGFPYYNGRWPYISAALEQASMLIERHGLKTALELGAPIRPTIVGAAVMDIKAHADLDPTLPIMIHDATKAPWPADDKAYDLFVALQVFEHLRDRQREAFLEVRRVARHAIISLPIDWEMDDPPELPPPDLQRTRVVVVRAGRPDARHRGKRWHAPSPHLRLRRLACVSLPARRRVGMPLNVLSRAQERRWRIWYPSTVAAKR